MTSNRINANPNAFADKPIEKPVSRLKISNKQKPEAKSVAAFEKAADELMSDKQERNKKAIEYTSKFMSILNDKTLRQNKTKDALDSEKTAISNIIALGLAVNQDETEAEGMGSIAIINIILNILLSQRERNNQLEYELQLIKNKLEKAK